MTCITRCYILLHYLIYKQINNMTKKELEKIRQRHLNRSKYKRAFLKLVGVFRKLRGYFVLVIVFAAIPAVIILPNL